MPPVLVTATRVEKRIEDIPASTRVIQRDDIETANPIDVHELFTAVAGVDLQGSGVPGSEIKLNFRGLTPGYQSKRVLVLMDGRRVNDPFQGNVEFALLPVDGVQRVEVLKGPASALYGSNAMGGVINIVGRRGTDDPLTTLEGRGGSHNTWHLRAAHGYRIGRGDYFVGGSHVQTDGYTDNADGSDRDWEAANVTGNLGWSLGDESDLRLFLGAYRAEGTDANAERDIAKNYQALRYTLNWNPDIDARFSAQIYRNAEDQAYDWKFPGRGVYELATHAADLQQSLWLGERHLTTAGVELRREQADVRDVQGTIDQHSDTVGVFAQDEYYLFDTLQLTAGLRWDHNDDFGGEISPRVGVLWHARPDVELYASWNLAHRAPGLSDRFVKTVFNGFLFEGNPDLQPETLTAYEVGGRKRFGSRGEIEATVFYNLMDDSFDFILEPDGVFRIRNVTRSRVYGFEVDLRWEFTRGLTGFVTYAFMDGEYREFPQNPAVEGNRLAYLSPHKAGAGLTYAVGPGHAHTLSARFVSARFGDARNTALNEMDGFVTVDWRSRYALNRHVALTLNVNNLFDATYEEFPNLEQPGITALFGVKLAL